MCIAIVKRKDVAIPSYETLETCFDNNPDGAGFAFKKDNEKGVEVKKGFFTFESFYKELIENINEKDTAIIHFRYATHGIKDANNCHPFMFKEFSHFDKYNEYIHNNCAMIHNGVINNGCKNIKHSDTYWLSKQLERGLEINNEVMKETNNKVAILYNDGFIKLYGEWIEENNILFSNGSYRYNAKKQSEIDNKDYMFCDCCGKLGENYFSTDVGYHFCDLCIKSNEAKIHECKNCKKLTTNYYCDTCNNLGFKIDYFLNFYQKKH
jgi:predicted glutamine amidotransferase